MGSEIVEPRLSCAACGHQDGIQKAEINNVNKHFVRLHMNITSDRYIRARISVYCEQLELCLAGVVPVISTSSQDGLNPGD
jgi:hypothetical protein